VLIFWVYAVHNIGVINHHFKEAVEFSETVVNTASFTLHTNLQDQHLRLQWLFM